MTIWELFVANLKMIVRNRQALFWALAFPLIFVVVFGLFRLDQPSIAKLAVVDQAKDRVSRGLVEGLKLIELLRVDENRSLDEAQRDLEQGDVSYVLVIPEGLERNIGIGAGASQPVALTLMYDQAEVRTSQRMFTIVERFVDKVNLALSGARPAVELQGQPVQARQLAYFDFLLPGFVGMGVMTYAVIGIATVLAFYRQQKILRRMLATPLPVGKFFVSLILAHLVLALAQSAIILGAGMLLFHGHVYGNFLWVFVLVVLANIVFLSIGFIVGSFARTPEAANGIANAVAMPMMFFSGVFFPTDSLPWVMRAVVQYLPLTPLLDALRGVTMEARNIWEFPVELGVLAVWVVVTSVVATRVFRFS